MYFRSASHSDKPPDIEDAAYLEDDEWVVDEHLDPPQGCCGRLFPAGYKQELRATLKITYGMVSNTLPMEILIPVWCDGIV